MSDRSLRDAVVALRELGDDEERIMVLLGYRRAEAEPATGPSSPPNPPTPPTPQDEAPGRDRRAPAAVSPPSAVSRLVTIR
jgi:hypothetical protein